ncbi:MAG: CHASE2 domain-containing protein, partial [Proteobacteria bacterium]|nr:CHASE2 domain-containing protein [Pseudomonadota bacterium]
MPPVRPTRANPAWLRLLPGALIGLAAALVSLTFWSGGLLQSWEAVTFDWRARLLAAPGPNTDNIRLILLDQKSLDWAEEHFGLSWPWPRQVYAPIIDFCRRAGAKSIAFDVVYTEPSVYGVFDDEALGTAMKTFGRTVMPVDLHLDDGSDEHWPDFAPALLSVIPGFDQWPGTKELTMNLATFPIPEVATNTTVLGNVSFSPDMDTVYRRLPLVQFFDGHQVPSLPLAAYLAAHPDASLSLVDGVLHVDSLLAPLRHPGTVVLNYRGTTEVFRPVSAAAVIQSELQLLEGAKPVLDPAEFKDKYVFFGFSATGLLDLRPTPLGGVTPGVVINATVLDNLLSSDFLQHPPTEATVLFTLLLS